MAGTLTGAHPACACPEFGSSGVVMVDKNGDAIKMTDVAYPDPDPDPAPVCLPALLSPPFPFLPFPALPIGQALEEEPLIVTGVSSSPPPPLPCCPCLPILTAVFF